MAPFERGCIAKVRFCFVGVGVLDGKQRENDLKELADSTQSRGSGTGQKVRRH
jgi:hypothetical protein